MSANIIISYDGTPNDDDAVALGKMLARGGATLALAYVRHTREFDARREELAQHDAEQRLDRGATMLGDPAVMRLDMVFNSHEIRRRLWHESLKLSCILFAILWWLFWRTEARYEPGKLVGAFLFFYGIFRFGLEFIREPDQQLVQFAQMTGLHMGQCRGFLRRELCGGAHLCVTPA